MTDKLCKGNCGNLAKHGLWCCELYHKCPGYRKKLSEKAKLRGNNGVRGTLSKNSFEKGTFLYEMKCDKCLCSFKKELKSETYHRKKEYLCDKCIQDKISNSVIEFHKKRIDDLPYEDKSHKSRKIIKWNEQGCKCDNCGFDKYDVLSGPYELHHIDGNRNNKSSDNEQVLCCNCHAMTDNYRFKNDSHLTPKKSSRFGGIYK